MLLSNSITAIASLLTVTNKMSHKNRRNSHHFYFVSFRCANYCDQYVCMSAVCLSVRSHFSKTTCPKFTKFSMYVTCDRASVLLVNDAI